jgi:hypothetical protein
MKNLLVDGRDGRRSEVALGPSALAVPWQKTGETAVSTLTKTRQ